LKEPLGDVSHHLLHTTYVKRGIFEEGSNGAAKVREEKAVHA